MKFFKYQGTGNDFVMIDDRNGRFRINEKKIAKICDRRFGVGADGLILLQEDEEDQHDFKMVYFNADGKEGSMCGNGGRCAVKFAHSLGLFEDYTHFIAVDGVHEADIIGNEEDGQTILIKLKMNDVIEIENSTGFYFLNTGSPHYVQFVENIKDFAVSEQGRKIRYNDRFKAEGTNVNFVQNLSSDSIFVRTYERGVEDETYSCGTGVTASALIFGSQNNISEVKVQTLGGELTVSFERLANGSFTNIYLIGPAQEVFEGFLGHSLTEIY